MSATGEHAAVELTEHAPVRTDWKMLGAIGAALVMGTLAYANIRGAVTDVQAREGSSEARIGRLEDAKATTDLHLQRLDDDMRQMLQMAERIDKNVQELQRRH